MPPFLLVNGMAIPAQVTGVGIDTVETGNDAVRNVAGGLARTRLAMNRTIGAQTIPLDIERSFSVRSMVQGRGLVAPMASAALGASRGVVPSTPSASI